jgi:predicted nucleic acid-binding protein
MVAKIRVLIDLNVILDTLQKREPFFAASARVLAEAETGKIDGLIAAHGVTTLFYIISKDRSPEHARMILSNLIQFLSIARVDQRTIEQALAMPWKDFEDAVQMAAAIQSGAQALITQNVEDFKGAPISVLQPAELLSLVLNSQD